MPTNNEEVVATRSAILLEAQKWIEAHEVMAGVAGKCKGAGLQLTAFFTLPNVLSMELAKAASETYETLRSRMESLANQAATEFDDINLALRRAVDLYEAADWDASKVVDSVPIYGQIKLPGRN